MDVTWDTIVIFGYKVVLWMFFFPTFDGWYGWFSQQNQRSLGPRGFDARPFASKYARCRGFFWQVLWVSMWKFPSGYGVTPNHPNQKRPVQYVLIPMIQLGIPSGSFLTIRLPNWIFVVTSWCSISAVETMTILTAQFDNVNCELSFRSYYQYRMSCPTKYTSKYAILSTVCQ